MFIKVLAALWIMPVQYQFPLNASLCFLSVMRKFTPNSVMMYWVGFKTDYWGYFSIYVGDGNENGEKEIALDLRNNGCHLQKKFEKSGWKVKGTRLFRVVSVENFCDQRNVWKVVLFFRRSEYSKRKFAVHFLKVIFLYHF